MLFSTVCLIMSVLLKKPHKTDKCRSFGLLSLNCTLSLPFLGKQADMGGLSAIETVKQATDKDMYCDHHLRALSTNHLFGQEPFQPFEMRYSLFCCTSRQRPSCRSGREQAGPLGREQRVTACALKAQDGVVGCGLPHTNQR